MEMEIQEWKWNGIIMMIIIILTFYKYFIRTVEINHKIILFQCY